MKPILIIDPGHGGKDPGGGSNSFWVEKNLTLDISLYQYGRFKELGVPVTLTRNIDQTLNPKDRTRIVRNSGAKYCLSNHINAGGGDGAEVIHSIYGGKDLAEAISQELIAAGQNMRRIFTRHLPNDKSKDYYFMIRETGSVITDIIEYGFADSKGSDIDILRNHWRELAEAVVKAFCGFIGVTYHFNSKEATIPDKEVLTNAKPKPVSNKQYLHLPSLASSWRVYSQSKKPIKGNERGLLNPRKFGGLSYEILGTTAPFVYLIQTRDFGKVQIYGHPSTGAQIKNIK